MKKFKNTVAAALAIFALAGTAQNAFAYNYDTSMKPVLDKAKKGSYRATEHQLAKARKKTRQKQASKYGQKSSSSYNSRYNSSRYSVRSK